MKDPKTIQQIIKGGTVFKEEKLNLCACIWLSSLTEHKGFREKKIPPKIPFERDSHLYLAGVPFRKENKNPARTPNKKKDAMQTSMVEKANPAKDVRN